MREKRKEHSIIAVLQNIVYLNTFFLIRPYLHIDMGKFHYSKRKIDNNHLAHFLPNLNLKVCCQQETFRHISCPIRLYLDMYRPITKVVYIKKKIKDLVVCKKYQLRCWQEVGSHSHSHCFFARP